MAKEPSARIRDQHGGNIASKCLSNYPRMVPTRLPNGTWRSLGGLLEHLNKLGRPKNGFQGRMGRSWTPLGALLEAFGAPKKIRDRLLAGPRAPRRLVSHCLRAGFKVFQEASRQPQERTKRGPDGSKKRSGLLEGTRRPFRACSKLLENLSSVIEAAGHHSRKALRKAIEEAVRFH